MDADAHTDELLALSSGFQVIASDGPVGVVETPLFPPDDSAPDFLVVRTGGRLSARRPVVSTALVERVDPVARAVHVHGRRREILRLPQHLPLAT